MRLAAECAAPHHEREELSMDLDNRSIILWIGVLLVSLAGLFFGIEVGIRAGSGFVGGLLGLLVGFTVGVFGARWTLGR